MPSNYLNPGPTKEEIEKIKEPLLLEFGVDWCPHCKAVQPIAEEALKQFPNFKHIQIEDGKGRRLGRTFQVKLWPTFIYIKDGKEISRMVRPVSSEEIQRRLKQ